MKTILIILGSIATVAAIALGILHLVEFEQLKAAGHIFDEHSAHIGQEMLFLYLIIAACFLIVTLSQFAKRSWLWFLVSGGSLFFLLWLYFKWYADARHLAEEPMDIIFTAWPRELLLNGNWGDVSLFGLVLVLCLFQLALFLNFLLMRKQHAP